MVRGQPVNVGVERANEAAAAIGMRVVVPEFSREDPEKPSDGNDFAVRHGADKTREAFEKPCQGQAQGGAGAGDGPRRDDSGGTCSRASRRPGPGRLATAADPWKEVAEGHPFPFDGKSKTNAYLFLKYHHRFAGLLCYNEFTDAVMLARCPPWGERDFSPRPVRDDDFFMLAAQLEYCDITVTTATAADAAVRVAKDNWINPPREYLSRLVWDRRPPDRHLAHLLPRGRRATGAVPRPGRGQVADRGG